MSSQAGTPGNWSRRRLLAAGGSAAVAVWASSRSRAAADPVISDPLAAAETAAAATVYGLPLVTMEATRVAMRTQPWAFTHMRALATAADRAVVSPNVDTLYSLAWVDLARSPVRLSIPATGDTFYLMELLDCWTDVYGSVGTRTLGPGPYTVLLARAGDDVEPGPGEQVYYCSTDWTWILGRTEVDGPTSLDTVHRIQDGYQLTPLDPAAAPPQRPPLPIDIPADATPSEWVKSLDAHAFLSLLGPLMAASPPPPEDAATVARLATLGIVPGQPMPPLPQPTATTAEIGYQQARLQLTAGLLQAGTLRNGWTIPTRLGDYGTNYQLRAAITEHGLGANPPEDAIYLSAHLDATNLPLIGARAYRLRFPAGQLPPAQAFWSITMYGADDYLVPNPLDRYALGSHDRLPSNPDGSTDILIGNEPPADTANWLPAPPGRFSIMLRAYDPDPTLIGGAWTPPLITAL